MGLLTKMHASLICCIVLFTVSGCVIPNPNYHEDAGDTGGKDTSDGDSDGDTDGDTDTDTDTDSDSDTDTDTDTDSDVDGDTDTDVDGDTDTDVDGDTDTDVDGDTDTDVDGDTDTDSDGDTDTDSDGDTDTDADTDSDADSDTDSDPCDGCFINNHCYADGESAPTNKCLYCSPASNDEAWSNRPNTYSCNDDLWCNGADTCDGQGTCKHAGDPCANGSVCNKTCNEDAKNCYSPDTTICKTEDQTQCASDGCGAKIEKVTFTTYCPGTTSTCNGTTLESAPIVEESCTADKRCDEDDQGFHCVADTECDCTSTGNWYDSQQGLCWQNPPSSETMNWNDAVTYCENGSWGGFTNWRLPEIYELIYLIRGCRNGQTVGASEPSLCKMEPPGCVIYDSCTTFSDCDLCGMLQGPDNDPDGTYWVTDLGGSSTNFIYWSSTKKADLTFLGFVADFSQGSLNNFDIGNTYQVRCVRNGNGT